MRLSRAGQGCVEALLTLPLLILLATGLTWTLYRSLVFYWSDYQAHEALICAQSESPSFCQNELENRLKKILIAGTPFHVRLQRNWRSHHVEIAIDLQPPLHIEKKF